MKYLNSFIVLLVTVLVSSAQSSEVIGRVIDDATMKPIRNAQVTTNDSKQSTYTNALGYFKLNVLLQERKLNISHLGYDQQSINVPEGITTFTVPLKKRVYMLTGIDLHLFPNQFKNEDAIKSKLNSTLLTEAQAEFPYAGGVNTFSQFFGNEFRFPQKELLEKQDGRLLFGFTIDTNGEYKEVGCLTDTASNFCNEFKRIISVLPKWTPARQGGEPVKQSFSLIIYYGLNDHWKKELKELKKNKPAE